MRHQWYGDNRDVVKWSFVYRWIEVLGVQAQILYVPMLTHDEPPLDGLSLADGALLPREVLKHFRDVFHVARLEWPQASRFGVKCETS